MSNIKEENNIPDDLLQLLNKHEDAIIARLEKKVVQKAMETLKPLLEKLENQANQQKEENHSIPNSDTTYYDQINSMQQAALEKIKSQEAKIASKMNAIQNRISRNE